MILLLLLVGGAIFVALHELADPEVATVAGLALLVAILVHQALEGLQSAHDRATAFRRWRQWNG